MKTTIIVTMGIVLMIGLVSAIYPGECDSFEFPSEGIVNWTVQDNSSSMEGFSFTQNGTNITYCLSGDFAPGNFTLTFYTEDKEVIIEYSSSSSSSNNKKCKTDWICSTWTECDGFYKTRICEKVYDECTSITDKPKESEYCGSLDYKDTNNQLGDLIILDNQSTSDDPLNGEKLKDNRLVVILLSTLGIITLGVISYTLWIILKEEIIEPDDVTIYSKE